MKYTVRIKRTEIVDVVVEADTPTRARIKAEREVSQGGGEVTHDEQKLFDCYPTEATTDASDTRPA